MRNFQFVIFFAVKICKLCLQTALSVTAVQKNYDEGRQKEGHGGRKYT